MIHRFPRSWLVVCVCIAPLAVGCVEIASPPFEGVWLKGDLHCHSTHSDGDSSVAEVIASAESIGLDFFVITDHDGNMDGVPSQWYDPDYHSEEMVMLYGVEWTTGRGHANVWAAQPFDYGELWAANQDQDAQAAIDAAHGQGALFSINHPSSFLCCPWEYEEYAGVDGFEVWNSMYRFPSFNFVSNHGFWDEHLLAGWRITALGGSDTHQLKGFESKLLHHAEPTTWVFVDEPSADAVLEAIRAGHVSISEEPGAPRIDFVADTDEDGRDDAMMGDNILLAEARNVTFRIGIESQEIQAVAGDVVELSPQIAGDGNDDFTDTEAGERMISALLNEGEYLAFLRKNGKIHGMWKITGNTAQVAFTEQVRPGEQVYYRIELMGQPPQEPLNRLLHGFMKALSNPIYFGYP